MKIYAISRLIVATLGLGGLGLSGAACKGGSVEPPAPNGVAAAGAAKVTETEYTELDGNLRVVLATAPGSRVTPISPKPPAGRWNMDSYLTESGGAQFNVTLDPRPAPGSDVVAVFKVEHEGKTQEVEAKVRVPGTPQLDIKLGFAPNTFVEGSPIVKCTGGGVNVGSGDATRNVGMVCDDGTTNTLSLAKGQTRLPFVATSKTLTHMKLGGVEADFKEGEAKVEVDPMVALARSTALGVVSYEGRIDLPFVFDGPGGPYHGEASIALGDAAAKGWLYAAAKGPSVLANERKRPPRKAVLAAVRDVNATGGLIWGLFMQGGREEKDYSLLAQEIDLVAIDTGVGKVVGTCPYERASDGAKKEVDKIQIAANVSVYDRKTGKKLASRAFEPGPHPGCAAEIQSGDGNFVNKADVFEIEQWLGTFVTDSIYDEALGGKYEVVEEAAAPDVAALPAATSEMLARIEKGIFGISRGSTPAQVEAILGPPNLTSPDPKMTLRNYLDNGVGVIFDMPGDTVSSVSMFAPGVYDKLHAKGLSDPLLDLVGQPFDAVAKVLGKPTGGDNAWDWVLDAGKRVTTINAQCPPEDGLRCTTINVYWNINPSAP